MCKAQAHLGTRVACWSWIYGISRLWKKRLLGKEGAWSFGEARYGRAWPISEFHFVQNGESGFESSFYCKARAASWKRSLGLHCGECIRGSLRELDVVSTNMVKTAFLKARCEWGYLQGLLYCPSPSLLPLAFPFCYPVGVCVSIEKMVQAWNHICSYFSVKESFTTQTPMPASYCKEQTRVTRTKRREQNEEFKNKVKAAVVKHKLYKHNHLQSWQFLKVNKGLGCL